MLGCLIGLRKLNNINIMQMYIYHVLACCQFLKVVHGRHGQCFVRLSFEKPKLINKKISSWIYAYNYITQQFYFFYFILRRQRKYSQLIEYYRLKEEKKMT